LWKEVSEVTEIRSAGPAHRKRVTATASRRKYLRFDSSLHVLWNAWRQRETEAIADYVPVRVWAQDSQVYARPKPEASVELLWAEREPVRYTTADQQIQLPPGAYRAAIVLTEESFHSKDSDGGYWATVMEAPVRFEITAPAVTGCPAEPDPGEGLSPE